MRISRPVRPVVAGLVGTTVMSGSLWLEGRLQPGHEGPVDYDSSAHVVTAAAKVLGLHPHSHAQRQAIFLATHWGYGSLVGMGRRWTGKALPPTAATVAFFVGCQAMAMTLFPTVGGTPPPWKWKKALIVSSLAQHALYAVVVAETLKRLDEATARPE